MATKSLLLVPVTVFLLVLAAQGKEDGTIVVPMGTARCSNDPSKLIINTPMRLMANDSTVIGTGKTTSTGQFSVKLVNGASLDQLLSLVRGGGARIDAPPSACGAAAGAGRLSAPVSLRGGRANCRRRCRRSPPPPQQNARRLMSEDDALPSLEADLFVIDDPAAGN
ncbi:hypothetical protein ACP70R_004959 [Stipagrostis hirtigluma subsp. patula]